MRAPDSFYKAVKVVITAASFTGGFLSSWRHPDPVVELANALAIGLIIFLFWMSNENVQRKGD